MFISDHVLDLILEKNTFEYSGCHAPHREDPLYGRAAYWRAYTPSGMFVCKITTSVNVIEPNDAELRELLREELKARFEAIGESVAVDEYGRVYIAHRDPHRIRPLLEAVVGQYLEVA